MKLRSITLAGLFSGMLYSIGFFATEVFRCLIADFGCRGSGDIAALFIVPVGFMLVSAVFLTMFLSLSRWLIDANGSLSARARLLVVTPSSFVYGVIIAFLFFAVVGDFASFGGGEGLWLNTIVASVLFAVYAGLSQGIPVNR